MRSVDNLDISGTSVFDDTLVQGARRDFPILMRQIRGRPLTWLDSAATTQKPRCVLDAMTAFCETRYANVHRGVHALGEAATHTYEEARTTVAHFIGASGPDEVVSSVVQPRPSTLSPPVSVAPPFVPTGIGALWGRRELLADMPPYQGGGEMIARVSFEQTTFRAPPHRFEAGTPPIIEAIGFSAACDYLTRLGLDRVAAHERALRAYAVERLKAVPGLRLLAGDGPNATERSTEFEQMCRSGQFDPLVPCPGRMWLRLRNCWCFPVCMPSPFASSARDVALGHDARGASD